MSSSDQLTAYVSGYGVVWQFCKSPVVGWDYEMDVKGMLNSYVVR